jgi:SSS family solute:Na+ symporter
MLVDTPITLSGGSFNYPEGSFLWIVSNINFQYFSILITIISAIVMIAVSYASKAPDDAHITGLTFATASAADKAKTSASWGWQEVAYSLVVMIGISGAYLYFTG